MWQNTAHPGLKLEQSVHRGTQLSTTMSSFNSVRSQALSLETQTGSLLSRYSSFAMSPSSESTGEEAKLENQIENLLHKVSSIE